MRIGLLLLSMAGALVLGQARAGAGQQKDAVTLGFCWAPGMKADVTASGVRTQTGMPPRGGTIRYRLEVSEQGEHLRIQLVDPEADLSAVRQPVAPEAQAQLDDRLSDLLPDYLVTRAGRFAGLVDLAGYQSRLRALLDKSLPPKVDRAAIQKSLDAMTSEPALNTRVGQEWNMLVTAWAGSTLAIGVDQTRQARIGAEGKGFVVTHTYSATARVPCRRADGKERQCVQLDLRSLPDPAAMKAQMGAVLGAIGRPLPPTAEVRLLEIVEQVQLVTEPECLIPHSFTRSKSQTVVIATSGKEESHSRTDRNVITYTFR